MVDIFLSFNNSIVAFPSSTPTACCSFPLIPPPNKPNFQTRTILCCIPTYSSNKIERSHGNETAELYPNSFFHRQTIGKRVSAPSFSGVVFLYYANFVLCVRPPLANDIRKNLLPVSRLCSLVIRRKIWSKGRSFFYLLSVIFFLLRSPYVVCERVDIFIVMVVFVVTGHFFMMLDRWWLVSDTTTQPVVLLLIIWRLWGV